MARSGQTVDGADVTRDVVAEPLKPRRTITVFLFLLITLVVVVGAVTLAVVGGGDGGQLSEAPPDRLDDPLPDDRPLDREDVEALRLPMTLRGYRMADVDDVLGRLGAELAERDARIAELEDALAGARTPAYGDGKAAEGPADYPPDYPPDYRADFDGSGA